MGYDEINKPRLQLDRNYGRAGGWIVSLLRETMPDYWELAQSWRVEE